MGSIPSNLPPTPPGRNPGVLSKREMSQGPHTTYYTDQVRDNLDGIRIAWPNFRDDRIIALARSFGGRGYDYLPGAMTRREIKERLFYLAGGKESEFGRFVNQYFIKDLLDLATANSPQELQASTDSALETLREKLFR